ncbi:MAG: hypothetical protein Q7S33_02690 [Nanoarchaeota archaeon]|nr:hypothetical protein [Nanoarchaeota archaeon]
MNKFVGYIVAAVGLLGLAVSNTKAEVIQKFIPISIPDSVSKFVLLLSLALVVLGIVLLFGESKPRQKTKEVPIYEGKEIIGYRREKK